jgi:LmbE family N-acetylglucosaminyl deacetylase
MPDLSFNELKPNVVLGIAAHPDDLDFSASGSFASWASQGADVYYLIITDGSKGSDDESLNSEQLIKIREEEQRDAAKLVGAKDVFFLHYPDAYLEVTMPLKKDITRVVRRLKPDVVVTTDPTIIYSIARGFINHSDHRAAGLAAIDVVYPMARDRLTFPELITDENLAPHKVKTLLLASFENGNHYVDITDCIDTKMKALAAHASQMPDLEATQNRMKSFAEVTGGKMGVNYAELFTRLDLPQ